MTLGAVLLVALLPPVAALTEAEAAKWVAHNKNNLNRGLAATPFPGAAAPPVPRSGRHRREPPPAYLHSSWWEGEVLDDDAPHAPAAPELTDPSCFFATEECELPELREPALYREQDVLGLHEPRVPCLTTEEGCTLEAGAGLGVSSVVDAAVAAAPDERAAASMDPCWWEDGCHAFAY